MRREAYRSGRRQEPEGKFAKDTNRVGTEEHREMPSACEPTCRLTSD